jgi:hypothetical protein
MIISPVAIHFNQFYSSYCFFFFLRLSSDVENVETGVITTEIPVVKAEKKAL